MTSDTPRSGMEQTTADRWAALYERTSDRLHSAELEIRRLEKRILQLQEDVSDWKAMALRMQPREPPYEPAWHG